MHSRSSVATRLCAFTLAFLVLASSTASFAQSEKIDLDVLSQIRDEGFHHSKVMDVLSELTDHIGPRLTGSPNMKRANEWTRDQLAAWGLQNAHLEAWGPFGRGWEQDYLEVRMTSPDIAPLYAYPKAWTPGTAGAVSGKAVWINIQTKEDMEKYKGQLAGKIVFSGPLRDVLPQDKAALTRYDEKALDDIYEFQAQERRGGMPNFDPAEFRRRQQLQREVQKFLADEKPLAVMEASRGDGGTMFVQSGGPYQTDQPQATVPQLVMAVEHWGRVVRLLQKKYDVSLELDVRTRFFDDAKDQWDTVAEIPGTDPKLKDEVVMLGAHLDSWHSGTGATDNGAGSAATMEAVRILKTLADRGVIKPRRTIRIALWSGEEEGLLGSRAYVKNHFGSREDLPGQADVPAFQRRQGPLTIKPDQAKVAAYFNIDNGTGKIRGIYCQENAAVRPIFEQWFRPFHDLGAQTVSLRNTGGTDHLSFDAVGIPGFQFIQDPVEYNTRTHHSNMDVYERIQANDMMQMSVIMASFVYNAAQRDEKLPRKPLPRDEPRGRGQQQASTPTETVLPANPPAKTAVGQ